MAAPKKDILSKVLIEIISIKDTIKNNMVTKDEFNEFKSGIYSHVDGFIKLHETLDTELVSLRHKYDRLDDRLTKVESKVGLAA